MVINSKEITVSLPDKKLQKSDIKMFRLVSVSKYQFYNWRKYYEILRQQSRLSFQHDWTVVSSSNIRFNLWKKEALSVEYNF